MDDKFQNDVDECMTEFNNYALIEQLGEDVKQEMLIITIVQAIGKDMFLKIIEENKDA